MNEKNLKTKYTPKNPESNQETTAFHGRSGSQTNKIESVKRVEIEKKNKMQILFFLGTTVTSSLSNKNALEV
jgi:hypothetical protein